MSTTVTTKGQVTIPKAIRDYLGIKPGTKVVFEVTPDGTVVVQSAGARAKPPSRFLRARGMANVNMTTDQIMSLLRPND
ncbi:AbrB/MazE/SpoVT family DNA-binding domain-containing protein [Roseomonas sp. GCM10028921]